MSDTRTARTALPSGVATGIGSWPGTDPIEAASVIVGELPNLPHLPELPARGLGADMIGRAGAILVDLPLDVSTTGYRFTARSGRLARRARDFLRADLDGLEEAWERSGSAGSGRPIKLQVAGPLTLAAEVELPNGRRALTDAGAVREIAESLGEGLRVHAAEVARRFATGVVVQLDEPQAPAVLAGTLSATSILESVPVLPEPEARALLQSVTGPLATAVLVHCCAGRAPVGLFHGAGAAGVSLDLDLIGAADLDPIGELLESGATLALGVVPTAAGAADRPDAVAERARKLLARLGFGPQVLLEQVILTPSCGLAGLELPAARTALATVMRAARELERDPEPGR